MLKRLAELLTLIFLLTALLIWLAVTPDTHPRKTVDADHAGAEQT